MRIDTNPGAISDNSLAQVYESAGYGTASAYLSRPGFVKRSFPPGVFGFFAFDNDGNLIGFTRVFSDDVLCSWIAELCIKSDQDHDRVRGAILREMIERFGHSEGDLDRQIAILTDLYRRTDGEQCDRRHETLDGIWLWMVVWMS